MEAKLQDDTQLESTRCCAAEVRLGGDVVLGSSEQLIASCLNLRLLTAQAAVPRPRLLPARTLATL